ncbi:MAG: hypothetical protein D6763_02905 [Alphaproteobacteria bacterium]|nr:MAG: hypothetical protein D6763_02905 [Alphaproteobacteria bacterium]
MTVSFEEHVSYTDPTIKPILRELRQRILALGPDIRENVTKQQRVAYSVNRIFVEVKVQKKRVLVRFFGRGLPDPKNRVTNIPQTHGWTHNKEIAIANSDSLEYAMPFIKASYHSS